MLDDPQYPIILVGAIKVQSVIPGRITDNDGHGVADAVVTVQGPDVNATSWPDGSFTLPVFDQPFAEFTVTVQAAGYEPLTITRDFRNADAIPLEDDAFGLVVVEVGVVLQRPGVLRPHDLHASGGQALELLDVAVVKREPDDALQLTHGVLLV